MTGAATFLSALAIGLLGAGHCAGMCSGIAGVLSIGTESLPAGRRLARVFAYNAGRITSYAAAGAVAGLAGATLGGWLPPELARRIAMGVSAGFLLLLALYMVGRGGILVRLERFGGRLWQYVRPLGRRWLPAHGPGQAFGLGLVWGWLPCGLVYTALAFALASGSALRGAVLMTGFGLGTLPALVSMGMAGSWLLAWRERPAVRYAAGLVLAGFAVTSLWQGFGPGAAPLGHMH